MRIAEPPNFPKLPTTMFIAKFEDKVAKGEISMEGG